MNAILYGFFITVSGFLIARATHLDEVDNLTVLYAFLFGFWTAIIPLALADVLGVPK